MSSDIQFGDLKQTEPQPALRPDQDAHFATCPVGKVGANELLIYADLDVMRDMEAHAVSNTKVELGGVMLGQQRIDDQGRPFVVITDCLRAEHYEATKGSFKFTHETWSQITRQRSEFHPDLEMVGWYHTHPGWSVFLSGMDLFICNNFFNRPLDVALVIDPCEQDRGWFQWAGNQTTRRTNGFVLTTGRFRQRELEQYARIYNKEPIMNMDPRYSGNPTMGSQPSVTLMDKRKPITEFAVLGILVIQLFLVVVLAWKSLVPATTTSAEDQQKITRLEQKLEFMTASQNYAAREKVYDEVLAALIASQTGETNWVEELSTAKMQTQQMQSNLEGQLALAEKLQFEKEQALSALQLKTNDSLKIESQLVETRKDLQTANQQIQTLKSSLDTTAENKVVPKATLPDSWWLAGIGAFAMTLVGSGIGYLLALRRVAESDSLAPASPPGRDNYHENEPEFDASNNADPQIADLANPVAVEKADGEFRNKN